MRPLGTTDPHSVATYRLVGVLGGGGMGRVYLGQSPSGRYVAIKVIRPELAADPMFRRRFSREVAAARLVNPLFTAAVVDADTETESPWLATTYIEGPSVEQRVRSSGPLSVTAVLTLATGLAEALASIHRAGLVHRDLKPANILLDDTGPHIIDFGIALANDAERMTTGVNVGTPSYMAPERIQGEDAGSPGDIFSLGATLFFAATGRTLINGGSMFEQINQVTQGRFDLAALPVQLRPFVVRCISLRPQDRPTAKELSRILIGTGVSTPTPGWFQPLIALPSGEQPPVLEQPAPTWGTPKVWQRRPVVAGAVLGVLGLAAGGAWAVTRGGTGTPAGPDPTGPASASPTGPLRPGALRWRANSGMAPGPLRRVVTDGGRLIGTDGPRVFATDPPGPGQNQAWSVRIDAEPVAVRDWGPAVLVSVDSRLWRVQNETGNVEFSAVDAGGTVADVALAPDRAFVGLPDSVRAFNRVGASVWRQDVIESPLVADMSWLVTRQERNGTVWITLREAATGKQKWQVTHKLAPPPQDGGRGGPGGPGGGPGGPGGPDGGPPEDAWEAVEARLGTTHLLLREGGDVRVIRLSDGTTRWSKPWQKPVTSVELIGDTVLMAADRIYGFRTDTGVERWSIQARGGRLAPAQDGRLCYVVAQQSIAAVEPATGRNLWSEPLPTDAREETVSGFVVRHPTAYVLLRPPPFNNPDMPDVLALSLLTGP
ncbi:protein kinase domain-containing protein [Catellatospora methionotrophica]|uniref:protein kinase domain-containing protein n=1 Tax=Catellatospora methionotrophica TaxID=121620 RepID=UPI0033F0A3B3